MQLADWTSPEKYDMSASELVVVCLGERADLTSMLWLIMEIIRLETNPSIAECGGCLPHFSSCACPVFRSGVLPIHIPCHRRHALHRITRPA